MRLILSDPLLLPVWLPFVAGVACLLVPKALEKACGLFSLVVSAITLYLVWPLYKAGSGAFSYRGLISLNVDRLNGFILLATAGFSVLVILYSLGYMKNKERLREYYAYILWSIGAACGALLANEFVLLITFWGFLAITLYLLIGISGPQASKAAKKSFIIVGGSDGILILGAAILWFIRGSTAMDLEPVTFSRTLSYVAFFCMSIAAFAKAGAMPFHSWVPDCGEKAPAPVAAFMPAALDKFLGIYLFARIATDVFLMTPGLKALMMLAGAISIICAVMMALVQHDMKRLLSYHAVSQVGYMVLGIATGIPVAIAGALFHMLNNVIYKSCLFLCAGAIEEKAGTTDLDRLGGLAKVMPATFIACLVSSLAISGIPPLNGFASKWMIYQGIVDSGACGGVVWIICLVAAMLGSALTLASFVKVLHAAFLRKPSTGTAERDVSEVGVSMWVPMAVLALVCILFGVLAHRLPLGQMILPAMQGVVALSGVWWAGPATAMLIIAFLAGLGFYFAGTIAKVRVCETYIGGEYMDKTYVSDSADSPQKDIEVTGVDFYRTIQDMQPFKTAYRLAEKKLFDLYDVANAVLNYFVYALRQAHSGLLPAYLTWFIAGIIIISAILAWGL
jgi:formate hydrogenlyase subunit 3/multisubunit Na+/H+ antiporter MnhD subunit